jgi:capsular polysaccharide biosynthesis protein
MSAAPVRDAVPWTQYAAVVLARWRTVVATTVLVLLGVSAFTATLTPVFVARSSVALAVPVSAESRFVNNQEQYVNGIVRSCIALARRPVVLVGAVAATGADLGPDDLADAVEVRARRDTLVVEVRVSDPSAARAALLADAVALQMSEVCDDLQPLSTAGGEPFDFAVVGRAAVPERDSSPRWRQTLATALVLGVLSGVVLAIVLDDLRPLVVSSAGLAPLPVLGRTPPRGGRRRRARAAARVEAECRARGMRTLVVVAARPGADVAVVAEDIAAAAIVSGRRVLVLDAVDLQVVPRAAGPGTGGPGSTALQRGDHDLVLVVIGPSVLQESRSLELCRRADATLLVAPPRAAVEELYDVVDVLRAVGSPLLGIVLAG